MLEEGGGDLYVCLVTVLWLGWIYVLGVGILNVVWWILLWILVPAGGGDTQFCLVDLALAGVDLGSCGGMATIYIDLIIM